tara:strand:- start:761 stop:970 length:210 start_codon:yes stop_codon:yes gene_type:complete
MSKKFVSDIDNLIVYVNSLEIAQGLIDNRDKGLKLEEDTIKKINDLSAELSFIIEDIDNENFSEFYGEE